MIGHSKTELLEEIKRREQSEQQSFVDAYTALAQKHGYDVAAVPEMKLNNDGTAFVAARVIVIKSNGNKT